RRIEKWCADFDFEKAPSVLAVGDIHLENFGTWRDADGRWVWGVNDFDEAAEMPYVYDLIRLAVSVRLAPKMKLGLGETADAILDGYRKGLAHPGPSLLDESKIWIRDYVTCSDDCRRKFWKHIDELEKVEPPWLIQQSLIAQLPAGAEKFEFR